MNKRLKKIITFILLFAVLTCIPYKASATDILFTSLTVKDGLSQGTVISMLQDSDGYMWIGTTAGLNRYNGYDFVNYDIGNYENLCIINGVIVDLCEDNNKNLWVGTEAGISKIDLNTYNIVNYDDKNSNLTTTRISSIMMDDLGGIYIATNGGLYKYDEKEDDFLIININIGEYYTCLKALENGSFYGLCDGQIFKYEKEDNAYYILESESIDEYLNNGTILDIYIDDNIMWIATLYDGLIKYDIDNDEVQEIIEYYKDKEKDKSYRIKKVEKDIDGNILAATENGLLIYDTSGEKRIYTYDLYDKYTIANNNIMSIMQDSSGIVWVGTYSGLSFYNPDEGVRYYNTSSTNEGILGNVIHGVFEDHNENLWIGCAAEGLTLINNQNKSYEYFTLDTEDHLNSNFITDISGNEEKVFVSTSSGINVIDIETRKVEYITEGLSSLSCNDIFVKGDELWVTSEGGLDCINLNDYSIKNYNYVIDLAGVNEKGTSSVFIDSEGVLWIGFIVDGGVASYDFKSGEVNTYKHDKDDKNSLCNNSIASINEDSSGNIWIGTNGGLSRLNKETKEFTSYTVEDGLSNNTVYCTLFDEEGYIWISTNVGVERLEVTKDNNILVKEYIKNNEFNSDAYCKLASGKLAFGALDGLYIIDPSKAANNNYIPKLEFDSIKVNGNEINDFDNVSLSEGNNSISIKLFTTIYENSRNTKFYYKFDKYSEEWVPIQGHEVTFSNLSSGNYTLYFKALSTNGSSSDYKSVSLKVNPPIYKGTMAKIMYIVIIFFVIRMLYKKIKYMDSTIEDKDRQLVNEMQEKNDLLEKVLELERRKNNYLVNMSHELRTPLNIIYSIQQLILELNSNGSLKKNDIVYYMDMSGKNIHRLLKLINDLIDSSKIDHGSYKLFVEEKDIIYVVEEATLSLKSLVEQKGINLIFDTEIEEYTMKFDEDAISRCIINIVNNASKFTPPGGEIFVDISDMQDSIKIDIKDNGCGIPEENLNNIFDRFSQVVNSKREVASEGSGLGLTITKRLVELHKGKIYVTSEVNVGSTFTIILPKNFEQ